MSELETSYPPEFVKAVNKLIDEWEGGYVNDPNDSGGETNMGICKRSHPSIDIKNLTRAQAIQIYYDEYWEPYSDHLSVYNPDFRAKIFNTGVLIGPLKAVHMAEGCDDIDQYRDRLAQYFRDIVVRKPKNKKFLRGWLRRAAS